MPEEPTLLIPVTREEIKVLMEYHYRKARELDAIIEGPIRPDWQATFDQSQRHWIQYEKLRIRIEERMATV